MTTFTTSNYAYQCVSLIKTSVLYNHVGFFLPFHLTKIMQSSIANTPLTLILAQHFWPYTLILSKLGDWLSKV